MARPAAAAALIFGPGKGRKAEALPPCRHLVDQALAHIEHVLEG